MQEEELGTYYLTDFLARHFESLVVRPFKLDTHPELLPMMFGNYTRLDLPGADRQRRPAARAPRRRPPSSGSGTRSGAPATASCSRRSSQFVDVEPTHA